MSVQACILFLACAMYLGYFANSLNDKGRLIMWSISLAVGLIPICELLYEAIRGIFR